LLPKLVAAQTPTATKLVHLPAGLLTRLVQRLEKIAPVDVIEKYILLPIPAVHEMIDGSRFGGQLITVEVEA
jgi:hypothetical protein